MPRLGLYRASAIAHFRRMVLPDGAVPRLVAVLGGPDLLPASSLSHMVPGANSRSFSGASDGAFITCRATRIARTVSAASAGEERKLNVIAGGWRGSAEGMWIFPLLSGRIG